MQIDQTIKDALHLAIEKLGDQHAVARQGGLPRNKPGMYLHGKAATIPDGNWEKLWPVLVRYEPALRAPYYLPPSELRKLEYPPTTASAHSHYGSPPCADPDTPPEFRRLCENWRDLDPDDQTAVLYIMRTALKKHGHNQKLDATPALNKTAS